MQKILHKDQYLEILIWLHVIYRAFSSVLISWTFRVFNNQEYGMQVMVQKQMLNGIWMAEVYEGKGKHQNWAEKAVWPRPDRVLAALTRCSGAFTVVRVSRVGLQVHAKSQRRSPWAGWAEYDPRQSSTEALLAQSCHSQRLGSVSLPKRGGMYLVFSGLQSSS